MDSKILLGKILQRFKDIRVSQVSGYNAFGYIRETDNSVWVTRQNGDDTEIRFNIIIKGIEAYKLHPEPYNIGPNGLRDAGSTHVNSPVWSLLHLLEKEQYC